MNEIKVSEFYNIEIFMEYNNYNFKFPVINAKYENFNAIFDINNNEIIKNYFPPTGEEFVKDWINENKDELIKMNNQKDYHKVKRLY